MTRAGASQPGEGAHRAARARFGMRGLSIIHLAGGWQSLYNEDQSIALIVNGEVYNYKELQTELRSRGHRLRTGSDAEVLVHLHEERGADAVHALREMFAFALHDASRGSRATRWRSTGRASATSWRAARWMSARRRRGSPTKVRRSILAVSAREIRVIPLGVDLAVFHPGDRAEARHALGLDPARPLLLCYSDSSIVITSNGC